MEFKDATVEEIDHIMDRVQEAFHIYRKVSLKQRADFMRTIAKEIEALGDELLQTCTVIVPAFNEGKQVYATLLSLAASEYPEHKLQLLAIDDGSRDDTWYWMQQAKLKLGSRLDIFQQPKNMGKRHALYKGFNLGTGDVFVTVDSDSVVEANTLRLLVSPFITNENCGAVAGNIQVLNNQKAL
ncbi:MAG: aldehyde dehydrogenase family protein, partial [Sphingobacteriales bacterium]